MQFPYRLTAFDVFCADNTVLDPGAAGDPIRTIEKSAIKTPVSVLDVGGSGAESLVSNTRGVPVSGNTVANGSGTETRILVDAAGNPQVDVVSNVLPTDAASGTKQDAAAVLVGAVDETAPATDTASSGLNGRLQRISQRITSLIALVPAALTGSGNFKTAVQEALPAGANAIGKLAANSGVDIGDVDVTSLPAIPSGDNNIGNVDIVSMPAITGTVELGATALAALETITVASVTAPLAAGTNNIGDVDVLSLPATPAGTNLIGKVASSDETGTVYEGTTALTPKFAVISAASSGENTLVAAVSTKKIRVLSIGIFGVGTAISIYFKGAAAGTAIWADGTNPIPIDKTGAAGAGGFVLGPNKYGWFQTSESGALILNLSGAQAVAGGLTYIEVE